MDASALLKEVERVEREFRLTTETHRLTHSALEGAKLLLAKTEAELARLRAENEALREALFVADAAIMQLHGCFPLDRSTRNEVFINEAATLIRSFTDRESSKRKLVVDQWLARNAGGKDDK